MFKHSGRWGKTDTTNSASKKYMSEYKSTFFSTIVHFYRPRVVKRVKVMFLHASVILSTERGWEVWHQMHHVIGHMVTRRGGGLVPGRGGGGGLVWDEGRGWVPGLRGVGVWVGGRCLVWGEGGGVWPPTPPDQTPILLRPGTPLWPDTHPPPSDQTPPPPLRSMRGWYAFYRNAYLLIFHLKEASDCLLAKLPTIEFCSF